MPRKRCGKPAPASQFCTACLCAHSRASRVPGWNGMSTTAAKQKTYFLNCLMQDFVIKSRERLQVNPRALGSPLESWAGVVALRSGLSSHPDPTLWSFYPQAQHSSNTVGFSHLGLKFSLIRVESGGQTTLTWLLSDKTPWWASMSSLERTVFVLSFFSELQGFGNTNHRSLPIGTWF